MRVYESCNFRSGFTGYNSHRLPHSHQLSADSNFVSSMCGKIYANCVKELREISLVCPGLYKRKSLSYCNWACFFPCHFVIDKFKIRIVFQKKKDVNFQLFRQYHDWDYRILQIHRSTCIFTSVYFPACIHSLFTYKSIIGDIYKEKYIK